jgi:hypothetical protein
VTCSSRLGKRQICCMLTSTVSWGRHSLVISNGKSILNWTIGILINLSVKYRDWGDKIQTVINCFMEDKIFRCFIEGSTLIQFSRLEMWCCLRVLPLPQCIKCRLLILQ